MKMDTVIIGGGLSGLACGISLAKRGKRVTIERSHDDILHIDGDPVMMPARVVIENVRRGINILVPPTLPDDV